MHSCCWLGTTRCWLGRWHLSGTWLHVCDQLLTPFPSCIAHLLCCCQWVHDQRHHRVQADGACKRYCLDNSHLHGLLDTVKVADN
jgi:hypothetical protein